MTLIELQKVLGNTLNEVVEKKYVQPSVRRQQMERTQQITSIAKQMINNADVILRTNKLVAEKKLENSDIEGLIK